MNETDITSQNTVVSVDPNEIFAQFGLNTPETTQAVTQRVMSINVENPISDTDYEEIVVALEDVSNNESSSLSGLPSDFEESFSPTEEVALESETTSSEVTTESVSVTDSSLLPSIPRSLLIEESTSRFSGAAWFQAVRDSTIIVAGQGGIGSYVSFLLSRMKPRQIFIYDNDIVELGNLSGQLYGKSMIGTRKVTAMASLVSDFSDYNAIMACPQKFTEDTPAGDIMICGFDNMEARATFFYSWCKHVMTKPIEERSKCLFIDGRLNIEEFQVFCITGDQDFYKNKYSREYLFTDEQAEGVQCSMKQTSHCATMIGSIIVNLYTNFIANTLNPVIKRDLPFKTYYDACFMFFKTEI